MANQRQIDALTTSLHVGIEQVGVAIAEARDGLDQGDNVKIHDALVAASEALSALEGIPIPPASSGDEPDRFPHPEGYNPNDPGVPGAMNAPVPVAKPEPAPEPEPEPATGKTKVKS